MTDTKFRADHVGSLLRPEALRAAQDAAVAVAVRDQEATGIDVVTDGEFRRGIPQRLRPGGRPPRKCSDGCRWTGCCSSTTTSGPAASRRCASCPAAPWREQYAKLSLVADVARAVWGRENDN